MAHLGLVFSRVGYGLAVDHTLFAAPRKRLARECLRVGNGRAPLVIRSSQRGLEKAMPREFREAARSEMELREFDTQG